MQLTSHHEVFSFQLVQITLINQVGKGNLMSCIDTVNPNNSKEYLTACCDAFTRQRYLHSWQKYMRTYQNF